jgi:hypothetical protein
VARYGAFDLAGICMSAILWTTKPVLAGRGTHYQAGFDAAALPCSRALELLGDDPRFQDELTRVLASGPYRAFRWEMPPLTVPKLARPFEFVLVDDPSLALPPEPRVFGDYFADQPEAVLVRSVRNLRDTAWLVVPRGIVDDATYAHLGAFLRNGPEAQVRALWACVAATAAREIGTSPRWISTAGGGVAWLHVRIDERPIYYAWRPYANET